MKDKTMRLTVIAVGSLLLLCWQSMAFAVEQGKPVNDMQGLREEIVNNRKSFIASHMGFTDSESKSFWPIYEAYQKDMERITQRSQKLLDDYAKQYEAMSDGSAKDLLMEFVLTERDRQKFLEYYLSKFSEVLPPKKVIRYYQLENKIRAVIDYDIAARVPLVK